MKIHEKLLEDSHFVYDLPLSQVRLIPDGENPWFLLIPMREDMRDWSDLKREDQHQLTDEIDMICKLLEKNVEPDKLNIASLGNMVPQLHIHIIARYKEDRAWPGPIWGTQSTKKYDDEMLIKWQSLFKDI